MKVLGYQGERKMQTWLLPAENTMTHDAFNNNLNLKLKILVKNPKQNSQNQQKQAKRPLKKFQR